MGTDTLDPRTTVLIGSITSGLMAMVLSLLARASPLPVPGLRTWVAGSWLIFAGLLLLGLRDWISHLGSITLGNGALVMAYIVWLAGTHRHLGARMRWGAWLVPWALMLAAITWFALGEPSFRVRVVIVAGLCAFISTQHALMLLRHPQADRFGGSIGITLTISWLLLLALVYGVRALHAAALPQGNSGLLTQDLIQIVYTASFTICNLMLVIGFATMASDHVRARIEEQAMRDPLTGILNRQALMQCLAREFAHSRRSGQPFTLAMLDVDHFKHINDSHGHPAGDRVLVALCQRLAGLVRPRDAVARYGGEEFVVVMPQTPLAEALPAAERLRRQAVALPDPALPRVTISIGLAQWQPGDGAVDDIVARADAALYAAKSKGRDRVEVAGQLLPRASEPGSP